MTNWKACLAVIASVAALTGCGDFDITCEPVAPMVLPDGSSAGQPVTDRSLGPEMLMWGRDERAVRETVKRVGGGDGLERTPGLFVRGYPAQLRDVAASPYGRPGISWNEAVCRYEIWLDPSMTDAEIIDYAARF